VSALETVTLGKDPISADAPAGAPVRYEPEYEELQAQIAKLQSVTDRTVKWELVVELSRKILAEKGKDMLVACYLALGGLRQNGYTGLAAGLTVCNDMLNTFWETMFPKLKRARARGQALEWLASKVDPMPDPTPADREAIETCIDLIRQIYDFTGEKLGSDAPALGPMRRELESKLASLPEPQPDPPPAPEPAPAAEAAPAEAAPAPTAAPAPSPAAAPAPAPAPVQVAAPSAAPAPPADVSKVEQVLNDAWESLTQSADLLFSANRSDPQSYHVRRVAAWSGIKKLPALQGGSFSFPGGGGMAKKMEELQEAEDWNALLELAEPLVSKQKLWLEPSYYAAQALEGLGPRYQSAWEAVVGQMVGYVLRHPALLEANFKNGYPVASGGCRIWLSSHMSSGGGGGASDDASDPSGALEEARALLLQGGLADAVRTLEAGLSEQRSRRGRFRWAMAVAQLCLDGDKAELASFRLRSLQDELERYALVEWEPELAVTYLGLSYKCARAQGDAGAAEAKQIYERLCRVDMAAALELDG